ncbi:hypothetical protein PsYK624_145860 [Phanerochaete sordida]|uniref:Uncharacterized protein n=1 Tax=Phanerochaete sordida TaxID=48140 RepID=A0A9P3GMW5_9APHY|nr:hypothetical protein PsYK624_145860 [Phanerochaete sordida]
MWADVDRICAYQVPSTSPSCWPPTSREGLTYSLSGPSTASRKPPSPEHNQPSILAQRLLLDLWQYDARQSLNHSADRSPQAGCSLKFQAESGITLSGERRMLFGLWRD